MQKAREMITQVESASCLENPSLRHHRKTLGKKMFLCKFKVVLSLSYWSISFGGLHAEDPGTRPKDYIYLLLTQISNGLVFMAGNFCTS